MTILTPFKVTATATTQRNRLLDAEPMRAPLTPFPTVTRIAPAVVVRPTSACSAAGPSMHSALKHPGSTRWMHLARSQCLKPVHTPCQHRQLHVCLAHNSADTSVEQPENSTAVPSAQVAGAADSDKREAVSPAGLVDNWGEADGQHEDEWQAPKPFSLKNMDWGLTALLSFILVLSFGAFRVLNHFRVYQTSRRPPGEGVVTVVPVRSNSTNTSSSSSNSQTNAQPKAAAKSRTKIGKSTGADKGHAADKAAQDKASPSSKAASKAPPKPAFPGAAAVAEATAAANAAEAATAAAAAAQGDGLHGPNAVGGQGVGAPQLSPLDKGFSSTPAPWTSHDLGSISLAPLQELVPPLPDIEHIKAELPSQTVEMAEVDALPQEDSSIPALRERANMAMKASAAAVEASQRASAYSAAASSAASRAAEAAERATAAAASVQSALEKSSERAMADAIVRMNKAVEMVADAESRAASAAAAATAFQDVSENQAAVASRVAVLPEAGPGSTKDAQQQRQQQQQKGAYSSARARSRQDTLHAQLFSVWSILTDWLTTALATVVAFFAWAWTWITHPLRS